jgi:hypothetical protein
MFLGSGLMILIVDKLQPKITFSPLLIFKHKSTKYIPLKLALPFVAEEISPII